VPPEVELNDTELGVAAGVVGIARKQRLQEVARRVELTQLLVRASQALLELAIAGAQRRRPREGTARRQRAALRGVGQPQAEPGLYQPFVERERQLEAFDRFVQLTEAAQGRRRREALTGYLFVGPSVLGFLVFILGPLLAVVYFSFTRYDVLTSPQWAGLDNYRRLLSDTRLHQVYANTLVYVVAAVVLINAFALVLAVLINQRLPRFLTLLFRSVYFFPSLVSLVYISLIWQALYQRDTGLVNYYLGQAGAEPVNWLSSTSLSRWKPCDAPTPTIRLNSIKSASRP